MSYASFSDFDPPAFRLQRPALAKRFKLGIAVARLIVQSLAVAAVLWAVLALPGVIADGSSTSHRYTVLARR